VRRKAKSTCYPLVAEPDTLPLDGKASVDNIRDALSTCRWQ
jgi:hypothetical protein